MQQHTMPSINTSVLISDANNFTIEQPINPYYKNDLLNREKAMQEHARIHELLMQSGVRVTKVPSPTDSQDGVYTANWALVRGNKAVLARLPRARRAEEAHAEHILASLGKEIIHLPANLKFSGQGDALACGNMLFCGSGYRSDAKAQQYAAQALGYERVQLQTTPQLNQDGKPVINQSTGWADSFFYDIDLALAVIKAPTSSKNGLIVYCPQAFTPFSNKVLSSLNGIDTIKVSLDEAQRQFATNLVSTGETVIMSSGAPQLAQDLQEQGLTVLCPEITELSKGGGFIRCMVLTLE